MELTVLIVLVLVILIAYKRNINTGLLGIVAAFLLGFFLMTELKTGKLVPISSAAGKASLIINSWSSSMFLTLLGVTFLFGIAKINNTLEILTKKIVYMVNGKNNLLPFVVFLIAAFISVIGPGPVNGMAIIAPIAAQIAETQNLNPFVMMIAAYAGNLAGGLSPITPSGFVASNYSEQGNVYLGYNLLLNMAIAFTLTFIVSYIILNGWKATIETPTIKDISENTKLKFNNWLTLGVILIVILAVIIGNLNIGLCSLTGAIFLILLNVAEEKEAIKQIPWGTILMVCGMGVLVNIVGYAGGIDYLTTALTPYINENTAASIMLISGALMSAVSSASGVVMPTLIPVAIQLGSNLNLDPKPLIYGIVLGAHFSCISPFSTVGGLALGALGNKVNKQKMFLSLLYFAIATTMLGTILVYFHILLYF